MNTKNIITGMNILLPFYDQPDGYHTGAGHDILYMYATDQPLPPQYVAELQQLGWFQEDADEEDEDGTAAYAPDASWACYC